MGPELHEVGCAGDRPDHATEGLIKDGVSSIGGGFSDEYTKILENALK